jgi:prolyl oligopeptidase
MTIALRPRFTRTVLLLLASATLAGCDARATVTGPPPTPRRPVTDRYHGVEVVDDYRWLEDGSSDEVKTWSDRQNAFARGILDALPGVDAIRRRAGEVYRTGTTYTRLRQAGASWLALQRDPQREQPTIVAFANPDDERTMRTVVDPSRLDPKGGTSIDWFEPSPDGRFVAVSLSQGGSERGDLHIFDVATGRDLGDTIPHVNNGTAGGSVAWAGDSAGVYYTRYPRPGERPDADLAFYTQVFFHALGTRAEKDRYEIGTEFPRIAEIHLRSTRDARFVLANVANGDGGEYAMYLRSRDGRWTQLSTFQDKAVCATFAADGSALFLISRNGAPGGKVLRLDLGARAARLGDARVVLPESDAVLLCEPWSGDSIAATDRRLYVVEIVGGPSQVRALTTDGRPLGVLQIPDLASIPDIVATRDSLMVATMTFTNPGAWYEVRESADSKPQPTAKRALSAPTPDAFANVRVERSVARAKDGTAIPLMLVRPASATAPGPQPTLLTGYGGYGFNNGPFFMPGFGLWLEQGGTLVVANIRGGGEFGEGWHLAGRLTHKQTVFDDFIAAAEHLVKTGSTTPEQLAIIGGSNGGLLMGAALTQRPDLFRAVVSFVGIYDMLRVERSPNGTFNVTEFGTVENPDQFRAMYAYSPYHHVKDGVRYPPTLFLTGANDPRVDPMQSRKMTARLQAAAPGTRVLLRTTASAGHGFGTAQSEAISQDVDVFAFLFKELGISYRDPRSGTR